MSRVVILLSLVALAAATGCRSPYHSDRGAVAGGLIGGATGAVIGNQSGNTAEGALVGGAVGALTGALVGDGIDQAEERNRRYIDAQMAAQARGTMTVEELITLTQQGVADDVIIAQIANQGMAHPVQTPDIVRMQQAGVSSAVMQAAQRQPPPPPVVRTVAPPPVIVEERVYGPPVYCGPPYHYHHRYYHRSPRVGFGIHYHH